MAPLRMSAPSSESSIFVNPLQFAADEDLDENAETEGEDEELEGEEAEDDGDVEEVGDDNDQEEGEVGDDADEDDDEDIQVIESDDDEPEEGGEVEVAAPEPVQPAAPIELSRQTSALVSPCFISLVQGPKTPDVFLF